MAEERLVSTIFEAEDRISPVINNITSSVNVLADSFDSLEGASEDALAAAGKEIEAAEKKAKAFADSVSRVESSLKSVGAAKKNFKEIEAALDVSLARAKVLGNEFSKLLETISKTGDTKALDELLKKMEEVGAQIDQEALVTEELKKAREASLKTIEELTKKTEDFYDAQDAANKVTKDSVKTFLSYLPIPTKVKNGILALTDSFLEFRTALRAKKEGLKDSTLSLEAFQGSSNKLVSTLSNRFPRAAQAVVVALRAVKIALISTGIGAIVVAVGLLIAALVSLSRSSGEAADKLTFLQKLFVAFKAIIQTTVGLFVQFGNGVKDLINGTKSFSELIKGGTENLKNYGSTLREVNAALQASKIATEEAEKATRLLDARVAQSRDTLNQLREAAADSNKSTAERVKALKEASDLEASLARDRNRIASLEIRAAIETLNAKRASGQGIKEAEEALSKARQNFANLDAETKARERADARAIQDLNREQLEQLKQLREAYARLQKQVESQLASARLESLTGVDRIQAELKIAIDAINEFEKEVQKAAREARQSFDAAPFAELRAIAEQKALEETRKFQNQTTEEAIENEKRKGLLIAQAITAASDENLNLEESRAALALEIEKEALEKRLAEKRRFYDENKKLFDEAAEVELLTLEANIADITQREIDLRKAARLRILNDRVAAINAEAELAETRLGLIEKSGDRTLTLEQFIEQERLKIQADAIEKRLVAIREIYGPNSVEVQLAEAQLAIIRNTIERGPNPFDPMRKFLRDALQINDEQLAQLEAIVGQASQAVGSIISSITEATEIQNRRYIQLLNERIRATEGALNEELRRQEAGYRNSADLYREQLRTLEEERARAEAESLERQKRAANAQLAVNSALQVSEYILATIKLFKESAGLGPFVGIAAALGGIAILASTVAQARLNAVKFAAPPAFKDGTEFVEGPGDGRSDSITAKLSRGERVLPAALNRDIGGRALSNDELVDIVRSAQQFNLTGILDKMNSDRDVIVQLSQGIDYDRMEALYRRANEDMTGKVISYLKTRPVRSLDDTGNEVISWEQGNRKHRQRVIRANKSNEE